MPAQLKFAWYQLTLCGLTAVAYLSLLPFFGPVRSMGVLGLIGLSAAGPLFYRRPKDGGVVADERDRLIHLRSFTVAWAALWMFMVATCMVTWWLHPNGTLSTEFLPKMLFVAWFVTVAAQSSATVIQYRSLGG